MGSELEIELEPLLFSRLRPKKGGSGSSTLQVRMEDFGLKGSKPVLN